MTDQIKVDLDLFQKYSRPGPRYTSYPTVPHFTSDFGPHEYRDEIIQSNRGSDLADLSLYFHFPFCKTLCWYCGCNVIITHKQEKIDTYLKWLKREIDLVAPLLNQDRKVVQMHWGGGSPCYLPVESIREIHRYITEQFHFADTGEFSIEVDPRRLTPEYLPALRELGFNRISFGVQDFSPQVQEAVNRLQPEELTRQVVADARSVGFGSVNVDLIYGLPYQTLESYRETLAKVIDLDPDRLAVFNYAHVPWLKKHQTAIPEDALPPVEERLQILKGVIEELTGAGYVYIGMDHFAKEDDELTRALREGTLHRNFQGYTTHSGTEVYAMGVSSISQLNWSYAQNAKDLAAWTKHLKEGELPVMQGCRLSSDDHLRRHVISEILCNLKIDKKAVEKEYDIEFDRYFQDAKPQLKVALGDGLVIWGDDEITVAEEGRLVVRNIAMAFDAYLGRKDEDKPLYSKTV